MNSHAGAEATGLVLIILPDVAVSTRCESYYVLPSGVVGKRGEQTMEALD